MTDDKLLIVWICYPLLTDKPIAIFAFGLGPAIPKFKLQITIINYY